MISSASSSETYVTIISTLCTNSLILKLSSRSHKLQSGPSSPLDGSKSVANEKGAAAASTPSLNPKCLSRLCWDARLSGGFVASAIAILGTRRTALTWPLEGVHENANHGKARKNNGPLIDRSCSSFLSAAHRVIIPQMLIIRSSSMVTKSKSFNRKCTPKN